MFPLFEIQRPFSIKGFHSAFDYHFDKNFDFKGESHDFWEITVVASGEVEVVLDERSYLLGASTMICSAPNVFHRIKSAGGTSPHVFVLSFSHVGTIPEHLSRGVFHLSLEECESFERLFQKILPFAKAMHKFGKATEEMTQNAAEGVCLLEYFLHAISKKTPSEDPLLQSNAAMEYRRLVNFMQEHVCDNLTLDQLSDECHISKSYIKKLFRRYTGNGAMLYYSKLRLRKIKSLLHFKQSAAQIAEQLHFSSPAYLSSFFKKHSGITLSQYRNRMD